MWNVLVSPTEATLIDWDYPGVRDPAMELALLDKHASLFNGTGLPAAFLDGYGRATTEPNSRGGRSAAEHLISAVRCVYNHAVVDGLIAESDNPALRVSKPRRLPSTRHGLSDSRIRELNQVAARTGMTLHSIAFSCGCTRKRPAGVVVHSRCVLKILMRSSA